MGVPMYNFSVPTGLRALFDHVLRAGETFQLLAAGPEGLLGGKRVIVIEARGGYYSEGPAQAVDFQEPYLRHLFAFVGITDVSSSASRDSGYGTEARAAAIVDARTRLTDIVGSGLERAA